MEPVKIVLKDILVRSLQENVLIVKFTKVSDGSIREMRCSLNKEVLPETMETGATDKISEGVVKTENPDVVVVYDLDKQGYRSFRVDSVISAEIEGTGTSVLH